MGTLFAMTEKRESVWDRPDRGLRGPMPSWSRDRIAAAAVALADDDGIDGVSMRTLAAALGTRATSLYRYVDSKDELIELMVDAVMAELRFRPAGGWRTDLTASATEFRDLILRHPWMAAHGAGLRNFGPNAVQHREHMLEAIDGYGLVIDQMLIIVETLEAFVRGHTLAELAERDAVRRSGLTQDAWGKTQVSYISTLMETGRYPLLARVILDAHAPHDADRLQHSFELGLERVLDGIAITLSRPAS